MFDIDSPGLRVFPYIITSNLDTATVRIIEAKE